MSACGVFNYSWIKLYFIYLLFILKQTLTPAFSSMWGPRSKYVCPSCTPAFSSMWGPPRLVMVCLWWLARQVPIIYHCSVQSLFCLISSLHYHLLLISHSACRGEEDCKRCLCWSKLPSSLLKFVGATTPGNGMFMVAGKASARNL